MVGDLNNDLLFALGFQLFVQLFRDSVSVLVIFRLKILDLYKGHRLELSNGVTHRPRSKLLIGSVLVPTVKLIYQPEGVPVRIRVLERLCLLERTLLV